MPDLLAGTTVRALDTPPTAVDTDAATITTTSTTYVATGADVAVTFVAPTTGRVLIHTAARMINTSTTSGTLLAPETRAGGTIGSGTVFEAAADGSGASHYGNTFARIGASHLLTGLTPGATYNTRLLMKSSNGAETATFALRELIVEPCT